MTDKIRIADFRGPRAKLAALVTERELAALLEALEALRKLAEDAFGVDDLVEAQRATEAILDRFDFEAAESDPRTQP